MNGRDDTYEDDKEIQALMDAYQPGDPMPRPPFTYWLDPRHWPGEASCWLAQHGWTNYCHVHDVIHWGFTHRRCCWDQQRRGLAALRKAGLLD